MAKTMSPELKQVLPQVAEGDWLPTVGGWAHRNPEDADEYDWIVATETGFGTWVGHRTRTSYICVNFESIDQIPAAAQAAKAGLAAVAQALAASKQ